MERNMTGAIDMGLNNSYAELIDEFSQFLEFELPKGDDGSLNFHFDDGIFVSVCESGDGLFAVITDTGIVSDDLSSETLLEVSRLCLQLTFATLLSSRICVAEAAEGHLVLAYSDNASAITGKQLCGVIDTMRNKAIALRQMIDEMIVTNSESEQSLLSVDDEWDEDTEQNSVSGLT